MATMPMRSRVRRPLRRAGGNHHGDHRRGNQLRRQHGSYPVVDALYTLAFNYPRTGDPAKVARENQREAFFRDELGQLFALGKETGMDITTLKGSYAGAMGWGQFMPSSYRQYAVDGDGDGKRDLFDNVDDVSNRSPTTS
jgi:membrane-bound lytic murein transglycosylase B